jgi:hypothetical protein
MEMSVGLHPEVLLGCPVDDGPAHVDGLVLGGLAHVGLLCELVVGQHGLNLGPEGASDFGHVFHGHPSPLLLDGGLQGVHMWVG